MTVNKAPQPNCSSVQHLPHFLDRSPCSPLSLSLSSSPSLLVYFGPCCPSSCCSVTFLFYVGPCSSSRSERVRMSGACLTPSPWSVSSSRWWWQQGRNGDSLITNTLYLEHKWMQSGCLSPLLLLHCHTVRHFAFMHYIILK